MNIYLVEDEHWALAELVELFKAYEPEHSVYAFENGDDAFTAASKLRPDLVLTDINMPGIDGLELIEKLNQLDPTIKCMILSVHDQFEYARQGMKFGVSEYLLKPVKKDMLFKAVDKSIHSIETEAKRREEWLNGSIVQMLTVPGLPGNEDLRAMNSRAYCMALLVIENGDVIKSWKDIDTYLKNWKKEGFLQSSQETEIRCVNLNCRNRVLLIQPNDAVNTLYLQDQLSRLFQYIQLQLEGTRVHMGYALKAERHTLYESFSALKQGLEGQIVFGHSTFLLPGFRNQDAEIGGVWDKVRVMETHFKHAEIMKGQAVIRQIAAELENKRITTRQLKLFIQDMLFSLKYNLNASKAGMFSINDLQDNIQVPDHITNYDELIEWLMEKITGLYCGQEPKDMSPKGLIPVLLQLIHTHYQANISLQQFAADHHVSLGYLSRMFKSQTGSTFSDYVAGYRIKKAKELLAGGVERLQEVSHLVGYEDTKHFSALFKKLVGEAPISFAKRNAEKRLKKEK